MFSKDSKTTGSTTTTTGATSYTPEPTRSAPARSTAPSIISPDLKIKGDLHCGGDIQIDGHVEGDVVSRTITIGEGADVRGAISAESVRVCGIVSGQIKGTTVTLAKTGKVIGDILHQTLSIEPGAYFEGQCRRIEASQMGADNTVSFKDRATATTTAPVAATGTTGRTV